VQLAPVRMDFRYQDWFPPEPNVGYETLIDDCMMGDATLFQRADMVEATWRVVQPILDVWEVKEPRHFPNHAAGADGPTSADALIRHGGEHRAWRSLVQADEKHHG
jgi:glucose-6-phosphate 1-dehydrogenase